MINKIYKRIHNKYLSFFKFLFFLRYLFVIFFISVSLFLIIPKFFDYNKKVTIIKSYLLQSYNLNLNYYENISFNLFPLPNLEIENAILGINSDKIKIKTKKINIFPKTISIYNYKNFNANKIILNNSQTTLDISELKILGNYIYKLENKLSFNNFNIKINKSLDPLINLKKIRYSNYGYNKNVIFGEIFDRKFKTSIKKNYQNINFELLNTGVNIKLNLDDIKKNNLLKGLVEIEALNSNLKFDFDFDEKKLKINNSYFRSKDLSFNNSSIITYQPYFDMNTNFVIKDINIKLIESLNLIKISEIKNIIKKINSKNTISYKSKKFSKIIIDDMDLNIDLVYGRLFFKKKFLIEKSISNCNGDMNLMDEYLKLNFNCSIKSADKRNFFKIFLINYKNKNEEFNLNFNGSLNILNKKIYFQDIQLGKNYVASKEDLEYFKKSFETILFDEDFLNIFKLKKIKKFILEVL